jgi:hypothetical protein
MRQSNFASNLETGCCARTGWCDRICVLVGPPAGDLYVLSDRRPMPPFAIGPASPLARSDAFRRLFGATLLRPGGTAIAAVAGYLSASPTPGLCRRATSSAFDTTFRS